jgi:hypothetical protein
LVGEKRQAHVDMPARLTTGNDGGSGAAKTNDGDNGRDTAADELE